MEKGKFIEFSKVVEIHDNLRKPINAKERESRISGILPDKLYPYYGATGQVGYIDDYLTEGEYVLLGEDGAPFYNPFAPKAYIVRGKTWVNNHAHVLKAKGSNKFLCHYLNYFQYKGYVTGTTRLKLTQRDMKRIPVPDLPLETQEKIVEKIEELFSELDKGIEELTTAKAKLKVYRQAVLKEAFENTSGWERFKFSDLLSEMRNGYGSKPTDDGEYKILRISSVRPLKVNLKDFRLNANMFPTMYTIETGDLLFTRYNGSEQYVGVCACVPELGEKYGFPDKLIKCTPRLKNIYHSKFLQYYFNQGEVRKYIRSKIKTTSGQKGIAGSDIKKTIIFLPSLEQQEQIVSEIESRLSICDKIESTIEESLVKAESLRQSILKEAFEGRLV